ncbi:hypothetical protein BJX64DRAFT_288522 [Aspergillus heterothallicus]
MASQPNNSPASNQQSPHTNSVNDSTDLTNAQEPTKPATDAANITRRYHPQKMVDGQLQTISAGNYVTAERPPAYEAHWLEEQQQQQHPKLPQFEPWQFG